MVLRRPLITVTDAAVHSVTQTTANGCVEPGCFRYSCCSDCADCLVADTGGNSGTDGIELRPVRCQ